MTTYTKRDLRAADLLALALASLGLVLALVAGASLLWVKGFGDSLPLWIGAVPLLALGAALHFKVRQWVRNAGREPEEYEGVPE